MVALPQHQPRQLRPGFEPTDALPRYGQDGLRIVMLVANDVTRDSRVLREAATLASAGHRVTVLGIKTARTVAPDEELQDGFLIRRLPYRARPPSWWVPPDFYSRIRYRADRQSRIHRAKLRALWLRTRRRAPGRGWANRAASRGERWRFRIRNGWRRLRRRESPVETYTPGFRRYPSKRLHRWRSLALRAWRTPLPQWRSKVRGRLAAASLLPSFTFVTAKPRAWTGLKAGSARAAAFAPQTLKFMRRVAQPWASIVGMLVWGSMYLAANAASRGSLEWLTGWKWRWFGWAHYLSAVAPDADVWHAHDLTSLPAAIHLKRTRGGLVVYDSHEIYLESGVHAGQATWAKAQLARLERTLATEADAVLTVNASVAEVLGSRLDRTDVAVLHNCPAEATVRSESSRVRPALGLDADVPLLLYHGALAPHRGVEQLLEAIRRPELRDAHLAFLGFGSLIDWLRREAADPRYAGRVHVLDAVAPDELPHWLVGVDVAIAAIQPSTLNHRLSSPNKVFEAIAAGTPVAGSDFPEFRRVISDPTYGPLGTLFDPGRPEEIARAAHQILSLPPAERSALRRRCRRASAERWNWARESKVLLGIYARIRAENALSDRQALAS